MLDADALAPDAAAVGLLARPPQAALQPWVRQLWACTPGPQASARAGAREHVLPTGHVHVAFRLSGPALRLFDGAHDRQGRTVSQAVVGGARRRFHLRDVSLPVASIGMLLQAGAAKALLGVPEDVLAQQHVALDLLWGAAAVDATVQQLAGQPTLAARLSVLEQLLLRRLTGLQAAPEAPPLHPAIGHALAALRREDASVAALAASSGWSHRAFIARFRCETGLAPKAYARIARLDRVLALAAGSAAPWVEIALAAGYADQAHLSRDFHELAGLPPQAWRRAAEPRSPRHVPR